MDPEILSIKNRFEIVGNSPVLLRAIETAKKVAPTDMTVLIVGESGVGKEAFSKIIHSLSKRKHGKFIAINCGAIPSGTIDSELFGHEKGSFTSAHEARKGYFETVDGGTIFLDEIGELPLETQSRLLRVLESGEFIKVGSSKTQKTDVRVIAATNKELYRHTQEGKFRDDLYYRLSTVTIKIPALRERKEDIGLLFTKFANDFSYKYRVPSLELTREAEEQLNKFSWPGNIRQLKNFVEQLSVLEQERKLTGAAIENNLPEEPSQQIALRPQGQSAGFDGFSEREILYKFLFEIKKDLSEMKATMHELAKNVNETGREINDNISPLKHRLLKAAHSNENEPLLHQEEYAVPSSFREEEVLVDSSEDDEPEEVLSLQVVEKDMIRKALQKFKGKRKPAADELGISERTLYRKIKEYDLE
ncbi:MAG: sigma-54 dependent transcriptional regulator [Bacteroidia bacterium]